MARRRRGKTRKGRSHGQKKQSSVVSSVSEDGKPIAAQSTSQYNWFERLLQSHYKGLLLIPVLLFVLAIIVLGVQYSATGDFITRAVSLKGGVEVTVPLSESVDRFTIMNMFSSQYPLADIEVRNLASVQGGDAVIIEASDITEKQMLSFVRENLPVSGELSISTTGSALGESFFQETLKAMLIAFVLMALLVFYYFRVPIPSIAVILAVISDIVITLAVVNLLGIRISTAGVAAFLMLIGYSVDTDILLSTRVLKRAENTVFDRTMDAMKTGMLMNITTLVALVIGLIVAKSPVLIQIMQVLIIGLVADVLNTWLQNAAILRWYLEKHPEKVKAK